jgi:hypothetical protein
MVLLNFKRPRAGDRQTAHFGRSAFRLTREGKVFEAGGAYDVVMKRRKWMKGWLLASGVSLESVQTEGRGL